MWSSYRSSLEVTFLGWGKSAVRKEAGRQFSEVSGRRQGGESNKYI